MNTGVGRARIGQWYARRDKGEIFRVVGFDEDSRTIEIQAFDGDLDEIDRDTWSALPLAFAAPPEDWTGPVDDVERDDLGYSETNMTGADWSEPLRQLRAEGEESGPWGRATSAEEESAEEESAEAEEESAEEESEGEDTPLEALVPERPVVPERLR